MAASLKASAFPVKALPLTGAQFRTNGGATGTTGASAYQQAIRALAAWARPAGHAPLVHALVHLGWCSGSGARATVGSSKSAAFRHGKPHLKVGAPAAPQVAAILTKLAAAGAPAPELATVWATFTGKA